MKLIKWSALVSALALSALASTSGVASATELCIATDCSEVYEAGQVIEADLAGSTSSSLKTSLGTITCTESTAKLETTAESGEPLPGEVLALTFGGCKFGATNCTVTAVNLPYDTSLVGTSEGNGTLGVKSGGTGNPGIKSVCGFLVNCTMTTGEAVFSVTGGSPAIVSGAAIGLTPSGGFCPEKSEWTVEYEALEPQPLFVNARPTVLCEVEPELKGGKHACPKGSGYAGEVWGSLATAESKFAWSPTEYISCTKVVFEGTYDAAGKGEITKLKYENAKELECTSTIKSGPGKVPVSMESLPLKKSYFEYNPGTGYQGYLWYAPPGDIVVMLIKLGEVSCYYRPGPSSGVVTNGTKGAATIATQAVAWKLSSEAPLKQACKTSLVESTALSLTTPGSKVYLAKEQL